jgi:hypothetical protein
MTVETRVKKTSLNSLDTSVVDLHPTLPQTLPVPQKKEDEEGGLRTGTYFRCTPEIQLGTF